LKQKLIGLTKLSVNQGGNGKSPTGVHYPL